MSLTRGPSTARKDSKEGRVEGAILGYEDGEEDSLRGRARTKKMAKIAKRRPMRILGLLEGSLVKGNNDNYECILLVDLFLTAT